MGQRYSGKDVEVSLPSGKLALFDEVNVSPSSGATADTSGGAPAGWSRGEVTAEGEIKLDTEELQKLNAEAEAAGSWEEMEALDMTWFASVGGTDFKVELFGCKLDFPDFTVDKRGGGKLTHTVKFMVTGEDFIHIDGVPLAKKPA